MTFEAAPAAGYAPHEIHTFSTPNDPTAVLDGPPLVRMIALQQRCHDLHGAIPPFEDVQEQSHAKIRHQKRIADLTRPKAQGGFGLPELAPQVVVERRELERAEAEFTRLQSLKEIRSARWTVAKQLEVRVSDWLLKGGIPGGCTIVPVVGPPLPELLKKGERVGDAVERYRHRLRELAADRHRLKSAPWPSSLTKEKAKAQLERWAEAAAPDFDSMIEHNTPLTFPMLSLSSLVHGEKPALAFTQTVDVLGVLCWLFKDQMLAKISAGLDEISDDKAALSQQQREEMEAEISASVLAIERAEVACIWAAEAQNNEILDFRADTSPQAVLGVRLVNQPRTNGSQGSSPMHAFDIAGVR